MMKKFVLIGLVLSAWSIHAQTIAWIDSLVVQTGDTAQLSFNISNNEPFVSFQYDLELPAGFQFITGSEELSPRANNHSLTVIQQGDSGIRFLAFSMSNSAFSDTTGPVLYFKLLCPENTGCFDLPLSGLIIGNTQSQNILDSSYNGYIVVQDVLSGIPKYDQDVHILLLGNSPGMTKTILLNAPQPGYVQYAVFNLNGSLLQAGNRFYFGKGEQQFPVLCTQQDFSGGIKILFTEIILSGQPKKLQSFKMY